VPLSIDQPVEPIASAEIRPDAFAVLHSTVRQAGGNADIQHAVCTVCHDVYPAAPHGSQVASKGREMPACAGMTDKIMIVMPMKAGMSLTL